MAHRSSGQQPRHDCQWIDNTAPSADFELQTPPGKRSDGHFSLQRTAKLDTLAAIKAMSDNMINECLRAYSIPVNGTSDQKALTLYATLGGTPTRITF